MCLILVSGRRRPTLWLGAAGSKHGWVVLYQGAYCFLRNGSTDAFRRQLVYLAAPVTHGDINTPLPLTFLESRAQVGVQIYGTLLDET